jgi:DGQHR domain-containing protein
MPENKAHAAITVAAIELAASPPVYIVALPGRWLLEHTTPSWRIKDPKKGFQRLVKEDRAKQIARTIIDKGRVFPNAITLATNTRTLKVSNSSLTLPARAKLLVVDGQHRLWAQDYAEQEALYACIIHLGKTEKEMAQLFLEINENQRRVPSSLRWDLVRLVRPAGDEAAVTAAELVYELATRQESPFYFALDLTGEKKDLSVKQGSLAPEIKTMVARTMKKKVDINFDGYFSLLVRFFAAVRSLDPGGWGDPRSTYYKARVLRALIRLLTDLMTTESHPQSLTADKLRELLIRIDPQTLSEERVRQAQGAAGVQDLYAEIRKQVVPAK